MAPNESPRARIVSSAPPPPREVEYRDDDFEGDQPADRLPVRRVRQRGTLASLIIYAFVGGAIAAACTFFGFMCLAALNSNTSNHAISPGDIMQFIFASALWSMPTFLIGGCIGAFVWAIANKRR